MYTVLKYTYVMTKICNVPQLVSLFCGCQDKDPSFNFIKNTYHLSSVSIRDVTFYDSILLLSITKQDLHCVAGVSGL